MTTINTSNTQSQKETSISSGKHCWDALDDGEDTCSGMASFCGTCSDIPTPSMPPSKATNVTSMITLAEAIASLGTLINHQTMTSDTQITNKVQGFINSQDYLSDLEKSLANEYYALQPPLMSGLLSMTPSVAKISLQRHVRGLAKDIEEELGDMSVED